MRQRLALFCYTGLFWMAFYTTSRIIFLLYHHDLSSQLSFGEILTALFLGMRMDAAISADSIILCGLLLTVSCFWNSSILLTINKFIAGLFLMIAALVVVGDLELYKHWGFRLDSTPLMYLGSEGAASVGAWVYIKLTLILLLLTVPWLWFYLKRIASKFPSLPSVSNWYAFAMLACTGLLFIPIRSSFSVAPLNTGVVYFSTSKPFANHTGINPVWTFFESVADDDKKLYPDNYYDASTSESVLHDLTLNDGPSEKLLRSDKPNILLLIMESFTARIVEPLGGQPGVTPRLNQLIHEGILFDNIYASGDRTDKGIIAILSGYPAQPLSSIIKYPNKTQSLPYLSHDLRRAGYHTSFVYGGDIGFANMESYVTTAGFSHITDVDAFPSIEQSKWGIHDHHVFHRLLQECDTANSPFFKVMLSLSSHEPFDVPLDPPFLKEKDDRSLFMNACYYADKSLGEFIDSAKKTSWWDNTLVIITADHGHRFPDAEELQEKGRFHIPMLWIGGAVAKKDSVIHTIGSQIDIANTLLGQVSSTDPEFKFSKNILSQNVKPFAVYIYHNGFGYIDDQSESVYDFDYQRYVQQSGPVERLNQGKAFIQALFSDYNSR